MRMAINCLISFPTDSYFNRMRLMEQPYYKLFRNIVNQNHVICICDVDRTWSGITWQVGCCLLPAVEPQQYHSLQKNSMLGS